MKITLTSQERKEAENVAKLRNSENRRVKRRDGKVLSNSLDIDLQGALGELAICKVFKLEWTGRFFENKEWLKFRKEGQDVGPLEVRTTKHQNGRLILHDKDFDDSPFVLVVIHDEVNLEVAGWFWGKDGKNKTWWRDVGYGRPCYYVPRSEMKTIDELKALLLDKEFIEN